MMYRYACVPGDIVIPCSFSHAYLCEKLHDVASCLDDESWDIAHSSDDGPLFVVVVDELYMESARLLVISQRGLHWMYTSGSDVRVL